MVEEIRHLRELNIAQQKSILFLQECVEETERKYHTEISKLFTDLIDLLDEIETEVEIQMPESISEFGSPLPVSIAELIKNFLAKQGIERLEAPINKIPEYCHVVGTVKDPTRVNGTVISVVKNGYRRGKQIIRPTYIISIEN